MEFWSRLFVGNPRSKNPDTVSNEKPATDPQTLKRQYPAPIQIAYSDHLIAQLLAEHRRLLALYADIGAAFAAGDLARTTAGLHRFGADIKAHLLTEEIHFYDYLKYTRPCLDNAAIHDMYREMEQFGVGILHFLGKYRPLGMTPVSSAGFAADFRTVGVILGERINREEAALFPLYLPPVHAL